MAAARTSTVSLDVAGSRKELTSVVVDMVAFDCILRLPWLDAANPVINWKTSGLLLPGAEGPVESISTIIRAVQEYLMLVYSLRLRYSILVKEEVLCTWPPSEQPLGNLRRQPTRS
jgi:hypothetical protein